MKRIPDPASVAAILYLAAPLPVFFLGWLEPIPGVILTGIFGHALYRTCRDLSPRQQTQSSAAVIYLMLFALAWAALGGAGHLVYANLDWRTRDAVYADLILGAWPPVYGWADGTALVLRSATGFFLAPAAAAKLIGIAWAPLLLLAWSALGVFLFLWLLPLPERFGARLALLTLAVAFFSGMDYPAILSVHGHAPLFPLPLEWWRPWTYTSLTAQLFWAPNHALALWLGTALIYRHRDSAALPGIILGVLPMLLLWTPFAIGLMPWAAWATWNNKVATGAALRRLSLTQWMAAALLLGLLAAYLSRPGLAAPALRIENATAGAADGWSTLDAALSYVQFAAFEFGILALLLKPRTIAARQALVLAVSLLLLLPIIRIGPSNDWILRISTPCLIVLLILALDEFARPLGEIRRSPRLAGLLTVIALGAITPGFEFARALLWQRTPPNYAQDLVTQQDKRLPPHYIGRLDLPALRWVFRPPSTVPTGALRQSLLREPPR